MKLAARLRRQLTRTFEPELSTLDRSTRAETIELLDLHTSWDTWERLRRRQRLSAASSRQLVTHLVTQAIDAADDDTRTEPNTRDETGRSTRCASNKNEPDRPRSVRRYEVPNGDAS